MRSRRPSGRVVGAGRHGVEIGEAAWARPVRRRDRLPGALRPIRLRSISTCAARKPISGRPCGFGPRRCAPPVRKFLVGHVGGGRLDAIDLKVAMTGADMTRALSRAGRSRRNPWRSASRSPTEPSRPPKACRRSPDSTSPARSAGSMCGCARRAARSRWLDAPSMRRMAASSWRITGRRTRTAFIDFRLDRRGRRRRGVAAAAADPGGRRISRSTLRP